MDDEERRRQAAEQEARALQALESIRHGGDLGTETLALSNEFTDRHTARLRSWVAARFRAARFKAARFRAVRFRGGRGPRP
ncbi:hypothetical protein NVV95_05660 [Herbiconiux sp. CPCC 205716]|uniref:Uncharacterized protein n=1 Tax=Herbiconiux gentiana TaxID=2970912 RepID=A0ABT2GCX1_9MICO|nr:hypothetical protein [Herbiconiux gentiana]MCS5714035.1 hypothetical protein [Herbiconiux gentiana]